MKIAIALEQNGAKLVHFGHAERFAIFDDGDGIFQVVENRSSSPPCGRDDTKFLMTAAARLLSDCTAVIAARFGPCALREVEKNGIFPFEMEGILDQKLLTGLARLRDYLLGGRSKEGRNKH